MAADRLPDERSWPRRIGWMGLIWAVSVMGLGIVAMLVRVLMGLAGLTDQRADTLSPQLSSWISHPLGMVPISASTHPGQKRLSRSASPNER